jgi:hypothetical protein
MCTKQCDLMQSTFKTIDPSEVELNVTWTRYTSEMHMLVGAELAAHAAYIGTQGAGASAWPG